MFFLDSWVWLEYFLEDDQWRDAEAIIEKLRDERGVISTMTLLEVTYTVRRRFGTERADRVAMAMQGFDNLTVAPVSVRVALSAAEIRETYYERGDCELSYADAVHVATAELADCDCFYSGDPDFAGVEEVETEILH
jgi:predicted nucleic acid-binding protein